MKIGYGCYYAQAQAVAWGRAALIQPVKALEYFLSVFIGNPWSVVGNYYRSYALTTGRNSGFRCAMVGMKVPINVAMTSLNKLRWTL
jgi:hypothetical protein